MKQMVDLRVANKRDAAASYSLAAGWLKSNVRLQQPLCLSLWLRHTAVIPPHARAACLRRGRVRLCVRRGVLHVCRSLMALYACPLLQNQKALKQLFKEWKQQFGIVYPAQEVGSGWLPGRLEAASIATWRRPAGCVRPMRHSKPHKI